MRLIEQLKQKIKLTLRLTELNSVMLEIRQKLNSGELTPQEYYFLVFLEKKHFQANIAPVNLLPDLSSNQNDPALNSKKVDRCEIVAEEFEAIERELTTISEMKKKFA